MSERRNIFGTVEAQPQRTLTLRSGAGGNIGAVIGQAASRICAAETRRERVRAVGSSWSSTDVFVSDEHLVETRAFEGVLAVLGPGVIAVAAPEHRWFASALRSELRGRYLAYVAAGTSVKTLYTELARYQLTLPVMGGASGQTLAGAISTGTHGADFSSPPICDGVLALSLLTPGGHECWIECEDERGVLRRGTRPPPGVEHHRSDALFEAALVSVGSLGIITRAVLEVVPDFGLTEATTLAHWSDVREALWDGSIFELDTLARRFGVPLPARDLRLVDLELFINPYRQTQLASAPTSIFDALEGAPERFVRTSGNQREVALITRLRSDDNVVNVPPTRNQLSLGQQIHVLTSVLGSDTQRIAEQVTAVMLSGRLENSQAGSGSPGHPLAPGQFHSAAFLRDTYDGSGRLSPGATSEICITTEHGRHVLLLDHLLAVFDQTVAAPWDGRPGANLGEPFSGFFSVRFQRPSKALLSMQHDRRGPDGPRMCHVEILALLELGGSAISDVLGISPANTLTSREHQNSGDLHGANDEYLRRFELAANEFGARMHWGQLNLQNRQSVEATYSGNLFRWRKARTWLSRGGDGRTFSSAFSERVGLESYSEVTTLCRTSADAFEVFGFREDGTILHLFGSGGSLRGREIANPFGEQRFLGPLCAVSEGDGHVAIYGAGLDNHLLCYERRRGDWRASDVSAEIDSGSGPRDSFPYDSPLGAVVSHGSSPTTHLFGFDREGRMITASGRGANVSRAVFFTNTIASQPCFGRLVATASGDGRLHLFGRSISGEILHKWRPADRDDWSQADEAVVRFRRPLDGQVGRVFSTPLACASTPPGDVHLFALDEQGNLIHGYLEDAAWTWARHAPPRRLGVASPIAPLAQSRQARGTPHESHFQFDRFGTPNSFFGELSAAGHATENRVEVMGLGRRANRGSQRDWHHVRFRDNQLVDWSKTRAPFWDE